MQNFLSNIKHAGDRLEDRDVFDGFTKYFVYLNVFCSQIAMARVTTALFSCF